MSAQVTFEYKGRLGFTDAEHTRSDGTQNNFVSSMSESGYVSGISKRFNADSSAGNSAWFSDNGGPLTRFGFTDSEHTRADGFKVSRIIRIHDAGYVIGSSSRYSGASQIGSTLWISDFLGASITRLGYEDAIHTRSDGYRQQHFVEMTNSGYILGQSSRFTAPGSTGWVSDTDGNLIQLGFTGSEYTNSEGRYNSGGSDITESGYVIGINQVYPSSGAHAWVTDLNNTTRIGYADVGHTRTDGYQSSLPRQITESGHIIGNSASYNGTTHTGYDAWVSDLDGNLTRLGFLDADHISSAGIHYSDVSEITESGLIIGNSRRFNGTEQRGYSTWVSDLSNNLIKLGLLDAEHTAPNGAQYSFTHDITESGHIIGLSYRYLDSNIFGSYGTSFWVADVSGNTTRLGLIDALHTRADGYQSSRLGYITESGYATGTSTRYSGSSYNGNTSWVYDISTSTQTDFVFSIHPTTGYCESWISIINENGWTYGGYQKFGGAGEDLGYRAYAWHQELGAFDIGEYLDILPSEAGWEYLGDAFEANQSGLIAGWGVQLANGDDGAFLVHMRSGVTGTGEDVVVSPPPTDENGDPVVDAPTATLEFDEISNSGVTTLTVTEQGPPPPSGFKLGNPPVYLNIETDAEFTGPITVCIDYSTLSFGGAPENLKLAHYEGGKWVDITDEVFTETMKICGTTNGLSPFAIFETADPIELLSDLVDSVAALNAKNGIINSLDAKLGNAQEALTDAKQNNDHSAINVLMSAFINAVEAQSGKQLLEGDADNLIMRAEEIAYVLSGEAAF